MSDTVCIQTFPNRLEADLAKSLLDANGIHALVAVDDAGGMYPDLGAGAGLFVLQEHADQARELLRSAKGLEES